LHNQQLFLFGIGFRMFGIKREVRCKSGAIPVAVSSINGSYYMPLNFIWEGDELGASQKTCLYNYYSSKSFREKG